MVFVQQTESILEELKHISPTCAHLLETIQASWKNFKLSHKEAENFPFLKLSGQPDVIPQPDCMWYNISQDTGSVLPSKVKPFLFHVLYEMLTWLKSAQNECK